MQESKASADRALQSGLGKRRSIEHMLKGRPDYPRPSREIRDIRKPLGNED